MTDPVYPFKQAKYYTRVTGTPRVLRRIVLHDMEAPEKGETAEAIANYFATVDFAKEGKKPSAHFCIDNNTVVQCVRVEDVANAAPGANNDGIHLELAGYGKQTRGEWLDDYSRNVIDNAASVAAWLCLKYNIPPVRLQTAELLDPINKGIVSHAQVSSAFKRSTHTDPGPNFPWDLFFERLAVHYAARRAGTSAGPLPPPRPVLRKGMGGVAATITERALVVDLQRRLISRGHMVRNLSTGATAATGFFGPATEWGVKKFQQAKGLTVDGIVGAGTWTALG